MVLLAVTTAGAVSGASWNAVLSDASGRPVSGAMIKLHSSSGKREYTVTTASSGRFGFADILEGTYELSVTIAEKEWKATAPFAVQDATVLTMALQVGTQGQEVRFVASASEGMLVTSANCCCWQLAL